MTKHFKSSDIPKTSPDTPSPSPSPPSRELEPSQPIPPTDPPETPPTPPTPPPPTPPPTTPPPPDSLPRRSSRSRRPPERLELSRGTKSYTQAVYTDPGSHVIRDSLPRLDPEGEGNIYEIGLTQTQTDQSQDRLCSEYSLPQQSAKAKLHNDSILTNYYF